MNNMITVKYNPKDKRNRPLDEVKKEIKYDLINDMRGIKSQHVHIVPINYKWRNGVSIKIWELCMNELNILFKRVKYIHKIISINKVRYKKAFQLVRLDS